MATGGEVVLRKYLKRVLVVARSARRGEYVVVHLASGSFFRTDRLGALAMRALVNGASGAEVVAIVDGMESGAGERARQLIVHLDSQHAMTFKKPVESSRRRLRRLIARVVGIALGASGQVIRIAPVGLVVRIFRLWPRTPIAIYAWMSTRETVLSGLRASGYEDWPEDRLIAVGRRCSADATRNYLFNYVSVALPRERLGILVETLFDQDSLRALARRLEESGPVIGVFMHNPLCVAVPNAIRAAGQDVIRVVVSRTHGMYLSQKSGRFGDFFGESQDVSVEESDASASGTLLRHLKAGRSVHLALDKLPGQGKTARVDLLGHNMSRNDGPAWLAVHSRRPVCLWTTHVTSTRVAITASPLLYPDATLPVEEQVASLSDQLYGFAEAAVREHPEAWTLWTHPGFLDETPAEEEEELDASLSHPAVFAGR